MIRLKDIIRELRLRQSYVPPRCTQRLSLVKAVLKSPMPYLKRAFAATYFQRSCTWLCPEEDGQHVQGANERETHFWAGLRTWPGRGG